MSPLVLLLGQGRGINVWADAAAPMGGNGGESGGLGAISSDESEDGGDEQNGGSEGRTIAGQRFPLLLVGVPDLPKHAKVNSNRIEAHVRLVVSFHVQIFSHVHVRLPPTPPELESKKLMHRRASLGATCRWSSRSLRSPPLPQPPSPSL